MQPLTHQLWAKHFPELRPHILKEWPLVDALELQTVGDDWEGLVAVIQNSTGLSADEVVRRLRSLSVPELNIGTGEDTADDDEGEEERASLAQLRFGDGISENERGRIEERLQQLNRTLGRFPAAGTDLYLTVKDRDTTQQKVALECRLPHFSMLVATSREQDLMAALADVREDLARQINTALDKRKEPVH